MEDKIISVTVYMSRKQKAILRRVHRNQKQAGLLPPGKRTFSAWLGESVCRPYVEAQGEEWSESPVTAGEAGRKVMND